VLPGGTLPRSPAPPPGPVNLEGPQARKVFRFESYPIYVVYSKQNQLGYQALVSEFYKKGQYELQKFANNIGLLTPDSDAESRVDARRFDAEIRFLLRRIHATSIGRTLFRLLKADVWIVPRIGGCYCAQTYPLNYETQQLDYSVGQGEAYVWFDPNRDFQDDTLFHEFIHAYRYGVGKFNRRPMANNEYNTEEFLAHTMENVYRSLKGMPLLFTYQAGRVADHPSEQGRTGSIYQHFLTDPEFIMVLKHFLDHDDLAKLVAQIKQPEFNPFRDYKILERMYLDRLGEPGIKALPEF
jgi:hypothetical protein